MGLTSKIKDKINEAKHEAKERINPLSQTNKHERQVRKGRQKYLNQVEKNARREAEIKEAQERGKRKAHREYNEPQRNNSNGSSRRSSSGGSMFSTSNMPVFKETASFQPERSMFIAPDPWGLGGGSSNRSSASKPKVAAKTTRIQSGGKTITIREQAEGPQEQQKKKRQSEYEFKDPFAF